MKKSGASLTLPECEQLKMTEMPAALLLTVGPPLTSLFLVDAEIAPQDLLAVAKKCPNLRHFHLHGALFADQQQCNLFQLVLCALPGELQTLDLKLFDAASLQVDFPALPFLQSLEILRVQECLSTSLESVLLALPEMLRLREVNVRKSFESDALLSSLSDNQPLLHHLTLGAGQHKLTGRDLCRISGLVHLTLW